METGCVGIEDTVTFKDRTGPVPHILFAFTEIVPPFDPGVAEIEFVVDEPIQPAGSVQVYEVAPVTEETLYVCATFTHGEVGPVIVPGIEGIMEEVILSVLTGLNPQKFFAFTERVPLTEPGVVVIEEEVEVPVQLADGNVHR
jgi:hypothetical protein